jgi:hypothetical protein
LDPKDKELDEGNQHECLTCYNLKEQASQQLMGSYPSTWVQPSRPFPTTGVDYAGPISLRLETPHSKTITRVILLFLLFVTKAVRNEVVTSLITEALLLPLGVT